MNSIFPYGNRPVATLLGAFFAFSTNCFAQTLSSGIQGAWERDHKATIEFAESESGKQVAAALLKEVGVKHLITFEANGFCACTVLIDGKETSRFPGTWRIEAENEDSVEIQMFYENDKRKTPIRYVYSKEFGLRLLEKSGKCVIVFRRHQ